MTAFAIAKATLEPIADEVVVPKTDEKALRQTQLALIMNIFPLED
ncbi:MAG: hypothetical protein AAFU53_15210 [Cyanobacteria bacterium J06632_3]